MRPLTLSSILLLLLILTTSAAQAQVTYTVTPTDQGGDLVLPGQTLSPGDQLILEIQLRTDGTPVAGNGASAFGYTANGLDFSSGQGVASVLSATCIPGSGCFGGLVGGPDVSGALSEAFYAATPSVRFFNHIDVVPAAGDGSLDLGVDGQVGTAQARLVFDVLSSVVFQQGATVSVGSAFDYGDGVVLGDSSLGSAQTLWVVPEPGSALLMGLGLAGLAGAGRSRRETTGTR